jgi:nucleoside-diphosphate-sugar epimerase
MRALVTGAAGFVGSNLVERLAADGHEVVAIDGFTPYYDLEQKRSNWEALGGLGSCRLIEADLATVDLLDLLGDVDTVFHQAGQPGVRASWKEGFDSYLRQNVLVTQRLLEAASESNIARIVYASSSSVYGNAPAYPTSEDDLPRPQSPYGVTKLAAEHLCGVYARTRELPVVSLRYFTVFGPRQRPDMAMHRLIEAALSGDTFPLFGDGGQIRDFTFVGDIVEANVSAAGSDVWPGTVLNVAGGTATTVAEVIGIVEELTDATITLDRRPQAPGDVVRTGGSAERAAALLGWEPAVALRDGLARQVSWHLERRRERPALATSGAAAGRG